MIVFCERWVFDTGDARAEGFDEFGGGGFRAVGVVGCVETVEDEHHGNHVLRSVSLISDQAECILHTCMQ